jgi:hypothetical protein
MLFCLFLHTAWLGAAGPAQYAMMVDSHLSPYAGGEDLLYGTRLIERGEELYFRKIHFANSKSSKARTFRLSEMISIWLPLNYEAMLVQHEVFGHGYRIRSLGSGLASVDGYRLGTPPPYGPGGGSTSYRFSSKLTSTEEIAISIAGVEATAILANLTKFKWLIRRTIDAKQSVLYLLSQQDLSDYIASMKTVRSHQSKHVDGHDIQSYLHWLNLTYPTKRLSSSHLRSLAWINVLDPFTFYSIWAWFHYISSGRDTKIPMIEIGRAGYLFGARLGLTPFGPEIFWENYFATQGKVFYGYFKAGRHAHNTYLGTGIYLPVLYSMGKWDFGTRFDLWWQPKLLLNEGSVPITEIDEKEALRIPLYSPSRLHAMHYGASLTCTTFYHWNKTFGLAGEWGAKSNGFLPGNDLWGTGIFRIGLSTSF